MKLPTLLLLGGLAVAGLGTLLFLLLGEGPSTERTELMPTSPAAGEEVAGVAELAPGDRPEEATPEERREAVSTSVKRDPEPVAKPKADPKGPKLRGRVVDANGFPVAGAEVRIASESVNNGMAVFGAKAPTTDTVARANGSFEVLRGKMTKRGVRVVVRARGYLALVESRTPDTAKGNAELGSFVLESGVVLAGVVVDSDGNPVPEVKLRRTTVESEGMFEGMMAFADAFDETGAGRTETDEEGRFELPHEPTGDYVLVAQHDSFPKARLESVTPPAGGEDRSLVLRFPPTARIAGRINDFPKGRKHISVQARAADDGEELAPMDSFLAQTGLMGGEHSSKVATDGSFSIEGLDLGVEYEVQAFEKDGIMDRRPCSDEKTAESGTGDLALTWDAGASIVFDVEDAKTRGRVRDVTVRYRWTTDGTTDMKKLPKQRTFPSSHVVLDELRPSPSPGTLELTVFAPGYLEYEHGAVELELDETIELGKFTLEKAPIVRVQVLDADTQKPVSRARVTLRPERDDSGGEQRRRGPFGGGGNTRNALAKTDRQGWCELPACSSGTATLTVIKSGYAKFQREAVLMPGAAGSEEVVSLYRGGVVEVLVVDSNEVPVPKARVRHRAPDGSTDTRETDREGLARLRNLETGPHGFRASRPTSGGGGGMRRGRRNDSADSEEEVPWKTVAVVGGASSSLVLEVPSSASVRGIVTVRGSVVRAAEVEFLQGEKGSADQDLRSQMPARMAAFMPGAMKTRTDDHGRFRFAEVPQGRHRVRVSRSSGALPHEVVIEVFEGENQVEVELPIARLEGRVVDTRGDAIQGASVRVQRGKGNTGNREAMAFASAMFGARSDDGARTDFGGDFVIEDVPRGVPLTVEAQASGYVTNHSEELTVDDGDVERGVRIILSQAGSVRVEFQNEVGIFQMVTARYEGDLEPKPGRKVAVARGKEAILRDLTPGKWRVSLTGRGGDDGDVVEVREGEETVLSLSQ